MFPWFLLDANDNVTHQSYVLDLLRPVVGRITKMQARNWDYLKSQLPRNYSQTVFSMVSVGEYHENDADWNYKDVPHLNIVHTKVDSIQAMIGKKQIATINFQKVLGITFPMVVMNYEVTKNNQLYFTSFGPFLLIIETSIKTRKDRQTEVSTKYLIATKRVFAIALPVIKYLIQKNYRVLMSEDLPMRERRGKLRKHGHDFYKPNETYDFNFTTEINRNNLFLNDTKDSVFLPKTALFDNRNERLGAPFGALDFIVEHANGGVFLWPSTCLHEGAEIRVSKECKNRRSTTCPWHGRKIRPIVFIDQSLKIKPIFDSCYKIECTEDGITITFNNTVG